MNTAILHGARPGDRSTAKTGSMGFKRAAAMAKRMGIDLTKLGSQADNVWSMLNDLAENDPKGYEEFLQTQMEEAKKERENSGRRCFTPRAGVVIKMTLTNKRSKGVHVKTLKGTQPGETLYMNMCGFNGCEAPTSSSGQPVVDTIVNRPTADALRIPLVVGKMRSKGEEGTGGVCHFVDVVFHPWVLEQSLQHTFFLAQVVDLAKQWVQEEVGVALDKAWTRLETKTYVGGDGKGGTQPLPFFLDEVVDQENPLEQRKSKDTAADGQAPTPVPPKTLSDPTAVLKELRQQEQRGLSQGDLATEHFLMKKPVGSERPLVQELGGARECENARQGSQQLVTAAVEGLGSIEACLQAPEKQRKTNPLIKKGFLSSSDKTVELYPEGGSTEGSKPGFLGKCKIVDTTQMSQSEIEEAMQQHAGPTPSQPRTRVAPSTPASVSGKLYAKPTMHPEPRAPDEEFERLVEAMDPDFGLHKETPEEDETLLELSRLASALGSMPSTSAIFNPASARDDLGAADCYQNPIDSGNRDRSEAFTAGMSQAVFPECSQALPTVPYVVSLSGDGRSLTVAIDLSVAPPGLRASDLELTVGDGVLRLTGPQGIELDVRLDKGVLAGSERASFQRKTRQFLVTLDVALLPWTLNEGMSRNEYGR